MKHELIQWKYNSIDGDVTSYDSKRRITEKGKQSETSIIMSNRCPSNMSNSRNVQDTLSRRGIDPNRRRTVILLDTTGTENKSISPGSIRSDKS